MFLGDLITKARQSANSLRMLCDYLVMHEMHCFKYHFTVNGGPMIFDRYKASLKLSKDYKTLLIHCYKPEEDFEAMQKRMKKLK